MDMIDTAEMTNLTELQIKSHIGVNNKDVELWIIFKTTPTSAQPEFGYEKYYFTEE